MKKQNQDVSGVLGTVEAADFFTIQAEPTSQDIVAEKEVLKSIDLPQEFFQYFDITTEAA